MSELEKFILKTLTWFDIFDYPLKLEEIHNYLINLPISNRADINQALDRLVKQSLIGEQSGYYYLHNRESNIQTRQRRAEVFEKKIKRAKKIAQKLRYIPWIKAITVCNTLGYSNAPAKSDIDLFIITKKDRVWLSRFFVLSILKFLRARPQLARFGSVEEKRQDKIDANFFLSENSLNIKSLAIKDDIYLNFWIIQQTPLYDIDNTYVKFIESNAWVKKYLPNLTSYEPNYRYILKTIPKWYIKIFNNLVTSYLITSFCEPLARWLQLKILPQKLKAMANQSSGVIISDSILKFHDLDRRTHFKNLWLEKIQNLKLP